MLPFRAVAVGFLVPFVVKTLNLVVDTGSKSYRAWLAYGTPEAADWYQQESVVQPSQFQRQKPGSGRSSGRSWRRTVKLKEILANHSVPQIGTLSDMSDTPSVEEAGLRTQRLIYSLPKLKSLRQFESS